MTQVKVRKWVKEECPKCYGEGKIRRTYYHNEVEWEDCSYCGGEGELEQWVREWVDLSTFKDMLNRID